MIVVSMRNCRMMSRRRGADGAADADLARPLHHAREHDVHDADAADEQRDRRDRDHDDVEDALRPLLLGQQLRRRRRCVKSSAPRCDDVQRRRGQLGAAARCPLPARAADRCRRSRRASGCSCPRAGRSPPERHINQVVPILRGQTGRRRSARVSCGPATPIT